ncbi:hypothetical protein FDA94_26315 [Herbidospora galbida]|uniref:Uncharacterized protein n=1 Tax=Herbidospora galbida TaxID=2575442 RepID=A0A4U3MAR3_9ACTN|nr:hypothetical protein [Herbidospora galbida]TKK85194.1 hypothetical protein FDA94_26315 [Herbidospora galbida]
MPSKTARSARLLPPRETPRPSRSRYAIGLVAAILVAGSLGYLFGAPDATENSVAEMRAAEMKRDATQVTELTSAARATVAELAVVMTGLGEALPPGGALAARTPTDAEVGEWQRVMKQAVDKHSVTPSGTTATNVARAGFRSAVDGMAIAVDTYAYCRKLPDDVRAGCLDVARRQRTAGVMAWSVAATQLDQINVDAGHGHQHVYLTSTPGEGAMTADSLPEGAN